jgi:peptidoglycan/xylan/chitin deacetylase (PgdA/CDA1 family)
MNLNHYINRSIYDVIRRFNTLVFSKELPNKIAIYFHTLEHNQYESFILFVNYFRNLGYYFCSPDVFFEKDNHKKLFVSFDDNYYSWFAALDLFDFLEIKCTFYINTLPVRNIASQREIKEYFSRIDHKGERKPLATQEIQEIVKRGHIVGSHTHAHLMLTSLPDKSAKYDIKLGKQSIEEIIGYEVKHFSYPFGMRRHFNEKLRRYCLEIGFKTIANAIPALQYVQQLPSSLNRSRWMLDKSLDYNLANIKTAGHFFEYLTGRSAVG